MSINDDLDKLGVAEEYLLQYASSTQEFEAALEHIRWVHVNKPEYRPRCEQILKNVVVQRRGDEHTMEKLRSF